MGIVFEGLNCYPLGGANLSTVGGILQVSNIGSSGLDGIMIEVPEGTGLGNNIEIEHEYYYFNTDGLVRTVVMEKNKQGLEYTRWELVNYYDSLDGQVKWGHNERLLPSLYDLIGLKGGSSVFDINTNNPVNPEPQALPGWVAWVGPIVALFGLAKTLYDIIFGSSPTPTTKTVFEKNVVQVFSNGTVETVDFRMTTDPVNLDIDVVGFQTYNIDTWGIKKVWNFQEGTNVLPTDLPKTKCIMIYAKNINDIKIHHLILNPVT